MKPVSDDPNLKPARIDRQAVKLSSIHIEELYNPKIEQIKYFEYSSNRNGTPIEMIFIEEMDLYIP